nr:putative transcriptional regulatory protein c11d3.11c [Quercus suber]
MSPATSTHTQPSSFAVGLATPLRNGAEGDDGSWSVDEDDVDEGDLRARKRSKTSQPISVSCERCKERKVRCDRGVPSCGWCSRNDQSCEYKERKKPGLRAGYGRELEARLDKLEDALARQQQVIQQVAVHFPNVSLEAAQASSSQHIQPSPAPDFVQTSNSNVLQSNGPNSVRYINIASPTHEVSHSSHSYTKRPETLPVRDYPSSQSNEGCTSSHAPLEPSSPNDPRAGQSIAVFHDSTSVLSQDLDFPPYDLLYALTDLYFKYINTWCPILHRRTTLDTLFGPGNVEEADRILLHAIVATTLRFSTDIRLSEKARNQYHTFSKQKVLLYGLENSSVKALQAQVILALDIVGDSNGPPGWNLLALITRSVVQLGLAVEATSSSVAPEYPSIYTLRAMVLPEPKSFIEDESRRRLFWMVYLLDRYATISTAFDFALDEKEVDRRLPCRDDLLSRNAPVETRWFRTTERTNYALNEPGNLGSFSYYVEIMGILSQIHKFLKRPVDIGALSDVELWQKEYRQLDGQLNAWKFSLPSEYGNMSRIYNSNGNNNIVSCIWIMLHVTYHTLHSSAAYPTTRSPIFTPSFSASQRCLTAVENIGALCTYVRANEMLATLGPPFAFSLWVAARLLLVHGSTIDHHVNPAIHPLVETLHGMGFYWKVAGRYATLLSRVLEEYSESERAPVGADGLRETPSTVRILADMRRTAYDLDFLISRQPRQFFGGGRAAVKPRVATPARTPAPNELEYLDVFDFFNMPRLSSTTATSNHGHSGVMPEGTDTPLAIEDQPLDDGAMTNEFNIVDFMMDANADWFTDKNV